MSSTYIVHSADVSGRNVIIIDDSLVRGETAGQLMSRVRDAGAREIHLRLTEPVIRYPCFYGIDFPTMGELLANNVKGDVEKEIAKRLGIESVKFQTIDDLVKGIGLPKGDLCLACLNGEYPTKCGKKRFVEMNG